MQGNPENFSQWFVTNGFFLLFWILTLVAIVLRHRWVRNCYLVFFFVSMLTVGLVFTKTVWPFYHWHVWGRVLPKQKDYFEVWLEDDRGRQVVYDVQAAPPLTTALLNLFFAPRMQLLASRGESDGMALWLLAKANNYKPPSGLPAWLRFPERERSHYQCHGLYENNRISPLWSENDRPFTSLLLKKKRANFGPGPGCAAEFTLLEETRIP